MLCKLRCEHVHVGKSCARKLQGAYRVIEMKKEDFLNNNFLIEIYISLI